MRFPHPTSLRIFCGMLPFVPVLAIATEFTAAETAPAKQQAALKITTLTTAANASSKAADANAVEDNPLADNATDNKTSDDKNLDDSVLERLVVSLAQQPRPWLSSAGAVSSKQLAQNPQLDIAALLRGMPGLQADQRANFAQDSRISIRGFGSRSSFGVRGIEVLFDDIPWSTSDGQSQPASIPFEQLASAEVLRGPFATLYGNAAGGVLTMYSQAPRHGASVQHQQSSDYQQHSLLLGDGQTELYLKKLDHQGYRPHNSALKRQAALRSSTEVDELRLSWRYDWSDDPLLQDPSGLTQTEFLQNPQQTAAVATLFNSHKSTAQRQLSLTLSSLENNWQLSAWQGERDITQFLALRGDAISAAGGVVALNRHFRGIKAKQQLQWGNWQHQWSAQLEQNTDQRRGYVNLLGTAGDLRRDESGKVSSKELALQSEYQSDHLWRLQLGGKLNHIRFAVEDYFVRAGNPDDSGTKSEQLAAFAAGFSYPLAENLFSYLSLGRGFETPTLTEMAYQAEGAGLNLALKPSRNQQLEVGLKWQTLSTTASLDWFYIQSKNELVVAQSVGGRTSYRNAAQSRRSGLELALERNLIDTVKLQWSSTLLDATFNPDIAGGVNNAGNNKDNKLPGVAAVQHQLAMQYDPRLDQSWLLSSTLHYRSKLWVDDNNSMAADSSTLLDIKSSWQKNWQQVLWQWWLAIDNVSNSSYAGAVVVNQANGRYFEPGTPRQFQLGFRVQLALD